MRRGCQTQLPLLRHRCLAHGRLFREVPANPQMKEQTQPRVAHSLYDHGLLDGFKSSLPVLKHFKSFSALFIPFRPFSALFDLFLHFSAHLCRFMSFFALLCHYVENGFAGYCIFASVNKRNRVGSAYGECTFSTRSALVKVWRTTSDHRVLNVHSSNKPQHSIPQSAKPLHRLAIAKR